MSTVNLYDVLDVSHDASLKEIKDAHRKLVLKFHSSKYSGDPEFMDMITNAYNTLSNAKKREEYDQMYLISKNSEKDHFDLKTDATSYFNALDTVAEKPSEEELKFRFEQSNYDMDKKHGYKRTTKIQKMGISDTDKMIDDLKYLRDQEEIETTHDKIFAEKFDINKFNEAFDQMHRNGGTELVPHSGNPHAWDGSQMSSLSSNFSTLDNYDNLYVEDAQTATVGNGLFGSVQTPMPVKQTKLSASDINKLKGASYVKDYNYKSPTNQDDLDAKMNELLNERLMPVDPMSYKNTIEYGVSIDISGDINDEVPAEVLQFGQNNDIKKTYKRLVEMRKKEQASVESAKSEEVSPDVKELIDEFKQSEPKLRKRSNK